MEKVAVLDIGSNSIQFLVAKIPVKSTKSATSHYHIEELHREQFVTGLGRDLDKNGFFLPEAMEDSMRAFAHCYDKLKVFGVTPAQTYLIATEASRVAANATDFFSQIFKNFQFKVTIISGEQEARLSALGVLSFVDPEERLKQPSFTIMDIGGASTELVRATVDPVCIRDAVSLKVGSVRYTGWMKSDEDDLDLKITSILPPGKLTPFVNDHVYCVAGTMTSVANMIQGHMDYLEDNINNFAFQLADFEKLYRATYDFSPEQFLSHYPFLGKRSQVMKGGLEVARFMLSQLQANTITVSTNGLMQGKLVELIDN